MADNQSNKQKELNTITNHILSDKMQELRIRLSNGNTRSYLGKAIATKGEVDSGIEIERFDVFPTEENEEGKLVQGIRIYLPDGRIGDFAGLQLATEKDIENDVTITRFNIGYPEDLTDEIREEITNQ